MFRTPFQPLTHQRLFVVFLTVLAASFLSLNSLAQGDRAPRSFAEIAKMVEPAVVSIDTKGKGAQTVAKSDPGDSDDPMDFFRRQLPQRPVYAVGSGFIIDKSGYIITNSHVIEDAARITVKLDDGEEFPATVVGVDGREETDLAVLKIDAKRDLPFLKFGDSDKAEIGDWVLAIGSPFGLSKSVSAGIISQTRRETPYATVFQRFIQTDAAINPGNSGGPLVNMDGQVIGINSQIATSTGEYNGVGFALPSSEASYVYDQIVHNGKVRRGYLGMNLESVKPEYAKVYGLKDANGAIITEIRDKQSPAALAGMLVGDVIVEFNGKPVESARDLITRVASTSPNETVSIGVMREVGTSMQPKTFSARLGERPVNDRASKDDGDRRPLRVSGAEPRPFGLSLTELTPQLAERYKLGVQRGLLVKEINPASYIADVKNSLGIAALSEGDLIQRINRVTVTDLKSFNDIVSRLKPGDPVVLHVLAYSQSRQPQLKIVQFTVK